MLTDTHSPRWRRVGLFALVQIVGLLAASTSWSDPFTVWQSGFEEGFPGEFEDMDSSAFTETGEPNPGLNEAWRIVDRDTFADVYEGDHCYMGWIAGSNTEGFSHRAYPELHADIRSPLVNSFMVYLDVTYADLEDWDWIEIATWANNTEWQNHGLAVRESKLTMVNLVGDNIGPEPQPDFPLRQWVRITVYMYYTPDGDGDVVVWQDGVAVLEGNYTAREGQDLMRAHWGLYTIAALDSGSIYNDNIQIWGLTDPLTDFSEEPPSPYDDLPFLDSAGETMADVGQDTGGASDMGTDGGSDDASSVDVAEETTTSDTSGGVDGRGQRDSATTGSAGADDSSPDDGCGCAVGGSQHRSLLWCGLAGVFCFVRRLRAG